MGECTATDIINEVSMSFLEELLKYKYNFESLRSRVEEFAELKRCTANITVDSISMLSCEKKIGNENKEKENAQVNNYGKIETNKVSEENTGNPRETRAKS